MNGVVKRKSVQSEVPWWGDKLRVEPCTNCQRERMKGKEHSSSDYHWIWTFDRGGYRRTFLMYAKGKKKEFKFENLHLGFSIGHEKLGKSISLA